MICSFGAILAWKSDAAAAYAADTDANDDYDGDRKSNPYMSPSDAGDTKNISDSQKQLDTSNITYLSRTFPDSW